MPVAAATQPPPIAPPPLMRRGNPTPPPTAAAGPPTPAGLARIVCPPPFRRFHKSNASVLYASFTFRLHWFNKSLACRSLHSFASPSFRIDQTFTGNREHATIPTHESPVARRSSTSADSPSPGGAADWGMRRQRRWRSRRRRRAGWCAFADG